MDGKIEILDCCWSPIRMVLVWFVVFISCLDDKLDVTSPRTPPPGALVANGPKFEIYRNDDRARY